MKILKPVNDKIVVKPAVIENEHKTEGGIILPDTHNQTALVEGEVIGAGHGMYSANGTLIPICVEVGDRIIYSKHNSGQEYNLNGTDVIVMSQNEVMSIIEEE